MTDDTTPSAMKRHWFHILVALADEARHGYAIREDVRQRTDGAVELYPATLYGSIRDLTEGGLIEPLEGEDDPDDDQRRRYYRLTQAGREALRKEVARLQGILDDARRTRALGSA
ncbi:MAG: PadR family transcriptional regulator [Longimicrobiales bacterium]|nr:PadR family transcriptional regulator [Longimicrobiales bacterium]